LKELDPASLTPAQANENSGTTGLHNPPSYRYNPTSTPTILPASTTGALHAGASTGARALCLLTLGPELNGYRPHNDRMRKDGRKE